MPISLDIDAAIDRLGDRAFFLEIAEAFAAVLPETTAGLEHSLTLESLSDARRLAHSLKTNLAALGAEDLRATAFALEQACADGDRLSAVREFARLKPGLQELEATINRLPPK